MATIKIPAANKHDKEKTEDPAVWRGAFNAYGLAFERIKRNAQPVLWFLGGYTILTIFSDVVQDVPYTDFGYVNYGDFLFLIFLLALMTYSLAVADNKAISVREAVRFSAKKYLSLWGTMILFALIVIGSLLLLIVPAIWTVAWFMLSNYAVADKDMGPIAALKESKRLSQQHKAKVWGIIGVSLLVSIVAGFIAYVPYVGPAVTAAVSIWTAAVAAILYRWLQRQAATDRSE